MKKFRKRLTNQQAEQVAAAAMEILRDSVEPMPDSILQQKLYEKRTELVEYALYKGINLAASRNMIEHLPRKGWKLQEEQPIVTASENKINSSSDIEKNIVEDKRSSRKKSSRQRKLNISLQKEAAIRVNRVAIKDQNLVYVLVIDKQIQYTYKKSRIIYIGKTGNGIKRIAESIAYISPDALKKHGVRQVSARIFTCSSRPEINTQTKLEKALLLSFREITGDVPEGNTQGKGIPETDEFNNYFARDRVRKLLEEIDSEQ